MGEQKMNRATRAALTRRRILDAAREVFLYEGYDGATLRDIARLAGVSTGAAFAHWPGKADIWHDVFGQSPVTPEHGLELVQAIRELLPYAIAAIGLPRSAWPSDSVVLRAEALIGERC